VLHEIPLGVLENIKKKISLFSHFFNTKLHCTEAATTGLARLSKAGEKDDSRLNNKLPGPSSQLRGDINRQNKYNQI
jgi:hypothetical protein